MVWWEKYPERFLEEVEKIQNYTNAKMRLVEGEQLPSNFAPGVYLAWEEIVTVDSGRKYRILIISQKDHPYSAPVAWILEPGIRRHHHMFNYGQLCLYDGPLTPDKTYVLTIRNWVCEWVDCYETGNWHKFT